MIFLQSSAWLCPGDNHPRFQWYHDSNWRPAGDFASLLEQVIGTPQHMTEGDSEAVVQSLSDWDRITFGCPMSNRLTARLLGYEGVLENLKKSRGPRLRYEHQYNVPLEEQSSEYVYGKELTERNWKIRDLKTGIVRTPVLAPA